MIFHEIYSVYFDAVTRVLQAILKGQQFTRDLVMRISLRVGMTSDAYEVLEAGLGLRPDATLSEPYNLVQADGTTTLPNCPEMPLTIVQKRWLKTILCNPRMRLFDVSDAGLEDVEPFYQPEDIVVFDREGTGDPWTDPEYIRRFRTILESCSKHRKIRIAWKSREGLECRAVCVPDRLEYSERDDRMRLWADAGESQIKVTLARLMRCEITDDPECLDFPPELHKPLPAAGTRQMEQEKRENFLDAGDELPDRLVLEITDERNALERAFFHFSHFQKQDVVRIEGRRYRLTMSIDYDDREEIANQVLSFGPLVRVLEPRWLREEIRERVAMQVGLGKKE